MWVFGGWVLSFGWLGFSRVGFGFWYVGSGLGWCVLVFNLVFV